MVPRVKKLIHDADAILAVNGRFGEMTTDGYTLLSVPVPAQKLIHVHASDREIGKIYVPTLGIHAGPNACAKALTPQGAPGPTGSRRPAQAYEATFDVRLCSPARSTWSRSVRWLRETACHPETSSSRMAPAISRSGRTSSSGSGRGRGCLRPQSGAMGYGLPAAVAAKVAFPERTVVCFAGDGDFQMNCQELGTAMQAGAQPIILILNNGIYGTIRAHQERHYPASRLGNLRWRIPTS